MRVVRTPDERFVGLPGYEFRANYAAIPDCDGGELRVHYLDEGARDAAPVLLLHGEPTWSYLYRHMIPPLVAAGFRVIAPDQVGFGRSDKPTSRSDYTYARHVAWMSHLVFDVLDMSDITLFGQDWGGLIGLRLVTARPDRFARVVIANTGLPDGLQPPAEAFLAWQTFAAAASELPVGAIIDRATTSELPAAVVAAYDAPFPDRSFQAGALAWPSLVPTSPDDPEAAANRAAWDVLSVFDKPFLCCFSDADPVTAGGEHAFIGVVPGARDQPHVTIRGAGHFLQEDAAPELADLVIEFIAGRVDVRTRKPAGERDG